MIDLEPRRRHAAEIEHAGLAARQHHLVLAGSVDEQADLGNLAARQLELAERGAHVVPERHGSVAQAA
jgi:hypothetical protein